MRRKSVRVCAPEICIPLSCRSGGETCRLCSGGAAVGWVEHSDAALRKVARSGEGEVYGNDLLSHDESVDLGTREEIVTKDSGEIYRVAGLWHALIYLRCLLESRRVMDKHWSLDLRSY